MTELEQEALSHQHSHGVWVVGLSDGAFAIFDHQNGQLLEIIDEDDFHEKTVSILSAACFVAAERHKIKILSEVRRISKEKSITLEDLLS